MDSNKKQRYDEMIEEWKYVYDRLPDGNKYAVSAAIIVANQSKPFLLKVSEPKLNMTPPIDKQPKSIFEKFRGGNHE